MKRKATLVIVGNIPQALSAVMAHHILSANGMVQDPHGLKTRIGQEACITKVIVDGDQYNHYITGWLNEDQGVIQPGTLLRVKWEQVAA